MRAASKAQPPKASEPKIPVEAPEPAETQAHEPLPSRLAGAYAWRALLESGAVIAAGSDAPVEKGDPLIEFYAAAHRHDLSGFAGPDWGLDQAVSREDAMKMLTWGPAFSVFEETERGTLEAGKRADISAFSVDLMQAEPAAIPTAQPVLTVSSGVVTHELG